MRRDTEQHGTLFEPEGCVENAGVLRVGHRAWGWHDTGNVRWEGNFRDGSGKTRAWQRLPNQSGVQTQVELRMEQ